jgi:hypothetical protein
MTPTRYELLIEAGVIYLRGYAKETLKGYFNVESTRKVTGRSLASLRTTGAKMAKHHGVTFVDRTADADGWRAVETSHD